MAELWKEITTNKLTMMCLKYEQFLPKRAYKARDFKARDFKARAYKARAYN